MNWNKTSEILPVASDGTKDFYAKRKVIFGSITWVTPVVGVYQVISDRKEWLVYDQRNDRYYDCPRVPDYWIDFPELPSE